MTFVHVPRGFFLRIDCASIRGTPIAADVSTLWRSSPLFQELARGASFDPIRDLDVMVSTSGAVSSWQGGPAASRWRVVLRHHQDAAGARALLAQMARADGQALVWRGGQGIASAILPGEISSATPYAIVLTADHEAVIAPDDELPAILAVARDHEARRDAPSDPIEPSLASPLGELARVETTSAPPMLASMGVTAARATVMRSGQGSAIHVELDFPTTSQAQGFVAATQPLLPQLAQSPTIVSLGLARPLETMQVIQHGASAALDTQASFDELRALFGALALFVGGGF